MITRLSARYVVGHDGHDHVVYLDGAVVFDDDQIVHVGHDYPGRVDVERDEGLALVGPGFVDLNALGDIDHAVFDTYQDAQLGTGLRWSADYVGERRALYTAEEEVFQRRYAFGQLLLNGITTALPIGSEVYKEWAETYQEMAAAADAAAQLGLRVYLGPSFRASVPAVDAAGKPFQHEDIRLGEEGLDQAIRFVKDFDGAHEGLVRGLLAPSRIENQTPELLRRARAASDDLACPLRLHAGQTLDEVAVLRERFGRRPITHLSDLGVLGARTLIPHAWAVSGHSQMTDGGTQDLDLLRESGTTVIFCPMAVARYAVVLETFDRYRAHGIRIAIGTDTAPPDMVRAMDTGMVLTKAVERRKDAGAAGDLYRAATTAGADALGRSDLGRLSAGAQADIVVFDLAHPRFGPIDDPIRSLLMFGNGRDVRSVFVAGRPVVERGRLVGTDSEADRARAQSLLGKYRASYSQRDYLRRGEEQLFPSTFRMVQP